ncbi:MAG: pyridoxamine 5'-phosphate oxidase family protein [Syntrophomonadaceae bacterium]
MPKMWMQDKTEMDEFLAEMAFGFLGLSQGEKPYVVPMNYAYHNDRIYLHAALKGLKLEYLNNNPSVCFTVAAMDQLIPDHGDPCNYSVRYRSVMARGKARLLLDPDEKINALAVLAAKYAKGPASSPIDPKKAQVTSVIVIDIEEMTGKYNQAVPPVTSGGRFV